jgi:hypothetical protein
MDDATLAVQRRFPPTAVEPHNPRRPALKSRPRTQGGSASPVNESAHSANRLWRERQPPANIGTAIPQMKLESQRWDTLGLAAAFPAAKSTRGRRHAFGADRGRGVIRSDVSPFFATSGRRQTRKSRNRVVRCLCATVTTGRTLETLDRPSRDKIP